MFPSVVSSVIAAAAGLYTQDGVSAPPLNQALADSAISSTVTIRLSGVVLGQAVVVSTKGDAITTGEVVFGPDGVPRRGMEAVSAAGSVAPLSVVAFDPVTDLAMVRLSGFQPGSLRVARLGSAEPQGVVLAVLPTGAVRAEVTRQSVTGVMAYSRRYFPLVEIRLERWSTSLGGAPVFGADGSLVGMLMASLIAEGAAAGAARVGPAKAAVADSAEAVQGPRPAATTYSLGPTVLSRVVSEFLTNEGIVRHPWIGIFFGASESGGAVIDSVVEGSPAEAAGFRKGDLVVEINGQPIATHLQLASMLMNLPIGQTAEVKVVRGKIVSRIKVSVIADPRAAKGELKRVPIPQQIRDRL